MTETLVWLVRHAETENPHVFNGAETDIGLSALGVRQSLTAAEWFRPLRPTVVVTSAMKRAIATARPLIDTSGVPHLIEADFHERRVGELAGTPFSLTDGPWVETLQRWQAGEDTYTTPGAESFAAIRERVLTAWRRTIAPLRGERVVLVAHGVVCKVLLLSLLPGHGPADWVRIGKAANLSVSELLGSNGSWRAESLFEVPPPVAALSAELTDVAPNPGSGSVA